ncbi:hypothetical protein NMG60_11005540, partial [Bertholletia excelsa]
NYECSLEQLSDDINLIYNDLTDTLQFNMSRYLLALIQEKIVSGLYVLSPLQVKFIKKEDLTHFLHDTLPECPDIMFKTNSNMIYVVMPHKDDVLVLMGLALMLFRLSHGCIPKDGYRFENDVDSFYYSLQQIGKVKRLYRIDLTASLSTMERSLILDRVKPLVGDGSVYELISSFLDLPIIDDDGNVRSDISFGVIPPVGEITRVLFNIVLMDTFDREFPNKFPGITFYRFIHEVYISTREYDEVIFDEKVGYALLEELNMAGKIVSIGPCDEPLLCYYKRLVLIDINSKVHVCYPIEY